MTGDRGRRRGGWVSLILSLFVAASMLVAVVDGPTSGPHGGVSIPGISLVDLPGTFANYQPGELYGGGSPTETCFTCMASAADGGTTSDSADPSNDVDTGTGDYSKSITLFDDKGIGADMSLDLTYDAQLAQAQLKATPPLTYAGAYGWGWSDNLTTSLVNTNGYVTLNQENGAQVTFTPPVGDGCPLGDYQAIQKYTIKQSSLAFCAPLRQDAQVGDFPAYGAWQVQENGGTTDNVYNVFGQLVSVGNDVNTAFDTIAYGVTPTSTSTTCPSSDGEASCIVETDTGGGTVPSGTRFISKEVSSAGIITNVIDPAGNKFVFGQDSTNDLTSVTDKSVSTTSPAWQFSYTTSSASPYNHDMATVANADSDEETIVYDSQGRVQSSQDQQDNYNVTYGYLNNCGACLGTASVAQDQMTTVTYPVAGNGVAHYDVNHYFDGLLTGSSFGSPSTNDPDYLTWTYNYNFPTPSNQNGPTIETVVHPGAANSTTSSRLVYDSIGNVQVSTDVAGNTTTTMYNDTGGNDLSELCWTALPGVATPASSSCKNPPAGSTSYTYDAYGHELTSTDPLGYVTRSNYWTTTGLLCWTAPPTVTATGGTCNGSGVVASAPTAAPAGLAGAPVGSTFYEYDRNGSPVFTDVAAATAVSQLTTNWYGNSPADELAWTVPPQGQGSTLGSTNPFATDFIYYNALAEPTYETGPDNQLTTMTYDNLGLKLTDSTNAGVTSTAYDFDGRVSWTYQAATAYPTNAGSPPPRSTSGALTTYQYLPGTDTPEAVTDPDGYTTTSYFSDPAYPTSPTEVADQLGQQITYTAYDNFGDPCVSGPAYPAFDTSTQCSWIAGDMTKVYNAAGTVLSMEDPNGHLTSYQYTNVAYDTQESSSTNNLSQVTNYTYDADGQLTTVAPPNGKTVHEVYDSDGRMCVRSSAAQSSCTATYPGTGTTSQYTYDAASELSQMKDQSTSGTTATSTYAYTNSKLTSMVDDNGNTVGYSYGPAGEVTCIAYPVIAGSTCSSGPSATNSVVQRGYDNALRLTSTTDWLGNTTRYGYGNTANPEATTQIVYPNATGESAAYSYDADGNLLGVQYAGPTLSTSDTYTYNQDKELSTSATLGQAASPLVGYNQWKQVQTVQNPGSGSPDTFTTQANGDILKDAGPTATSQFSYNGGDELTTSSGTPGGTTTYGFDTNGNRTSTSPTAGATTSDTWNALNQLTCVVGSTSVQTSCTAGSPTSGASQSAYNYAGNGLRSSVVTGASGPQSYTWDAVSGGSTPLDIDDSTNAYVYGPLLFGGTAPVEQIPLTKGAQAQFMASTPTGVQAVFGGGTSTSQKTPADQYTYGGAIVRSGSVQEEAGSVTPTVHKVTVPVNETVNAGDALVMTTDVQSSALTVIVASGTNTTWTRIGQVADSSQNNEEELWLGTVSVTTAHPNEFVAYSSGNSGVVPVTVQIQDYSSGYGATASWSLDHASTQTSDTSTTTPSYPTLTPSHASELYVGAAYSTSQLSGAGTSGVTYTGETNTNGSASLYGLFADDLNVSSQLTPKATESPSGPYVSVGGLFSVANTQASNPTQAIAAVGAVVSASSTGLNTLSVSPQTVGDAVVLAVQVGSATVKVSSVQGGGAIHWTQLSQANDLGQSRDDELWVGTVNLTGTAKPIDVQFNGSVQSVPVALDAQEYTAGTGATTGWFKDTSNSTAQEGSSTSVAFPSLTTTGANELYVGSAMTGSAMSAGTTTGFTYSLPQTTNLFVANPNSSGVQAPVATQATSGTSLTVGALLSSVNDSEPVVSSVSPAGGLQTGGNTITITGNNFTGATAVQFGSTPAASFTVNSITSITATAPAGAGTADVVVTGSATTQLYESAEYSAYGQQTIIPSTNDVSPFGFQGSYTDTTGLIYLINRYYDPTTDQFINVDPDVQSTDQPYAFTGDDPLNATDPLGLAGCGRECENWLRHHYRVERQCERRGGRHCGNSFGSQVEAVVAKVTHHHEVALCASAAGAFGYQGQASACAGVAGDGKPFASVSAGAGGGTPAADVGFGIQVSNAQTPEAMRGGSLYAGGSAGDIVQSGGGAFFGTHSHVAGGDADLGFGFNVLPPLAIPGEGHAGASYTWTTP